LREICDLNTNKIDEIKEKVSLTLQELNSNTLYNPFKWILESQTSTIEDLINHNKDLQEKINHFLATYNRFQTLESLGSVTESDSNLQDSEAKSKLSSKPIETENNQEYENLLSPEQQQKSPHDNESKTDNMSPAPKMNLINFDTSQKSSSDGDTKKRKAYLSRSEMKERLSPQFQTEIQTGASSLAIKHKEFTFKKDESGNQTPKPVNFNTQEFSVKNKYSFEKGEGLSRSVSSNQASDQKLARDANFQNISLLSKSVKENKTLNQKIEEIDCNNKEIEDENNETQIEIPDMQNPNCSECNSNENKYSREDHDYYPEDDMLRNRLHTEPMPLTDNSRAMYYENMSCYSPINSEALENYPQYFKDKIRNYTLKKGKVSQYPSLKEKIFEITGKMPKSTQAKIIALNKSKIPKNKKVQNENQKPICLSNIWENVPLTPEPMCKITSDTPLSLINPHSSKSQKASVDYTKIFRKPSNYNNNKASERNVSCSSQRSPPIDKVEDKKLEMTERVKTENLYSPSFSEFVQKVQHKNNKSSLNLGYFRSGFSKAQSFVSNLPSGN